MKGTATGTGFGARLITVGALLISAAALQAQATTAASCPAKQRLEAKVGFESFDCDGCRLRRDPETGMAYVEFTRPPVVRGVGTLGALRDGDQLTHVDGSSILTPYGARRLATLQRGTEARFTVRRNNATLEVALTPEYICKATPTTNWGFEEVWYPGVFDSLPAIRWPSFKSTADSNWKYVRDMVFSADSLIYNSFQFGRDSVRNTGGKMRYERLGIPMVYGDSGRFEKSYYRYLQAGSDVQPQGWFGFALDCGSCSYGSSDALRYWINSPDKAGSGVASLWGFNAPPRIVSVDSSGPARRAGLRAGDVLTAIDGASITSIPGGERFSAVQPGDTVQLRYTRGSTSHLVRLVAAQRPAQSFWRVGGADLVLQWPGQAGGNTLEFRGDSITVTEDPKTGERTITGRNMTIIVKPPKPPGGE